MDIFIKEALIKKNFMDKVSIFMMSIKVLQEIIKMVLKMDLGKWFTMKINFIKGIGKIQKNMEKGKI